MPAALERGQRRHGLEDVAERARMDDENLGRPSHRAYYRRGLGRVASQSKSALASGRPRRQLQIDSFLGFFYRLNVLVSGVPLQSVIVARRFRYVRST